MSKINILSNIINEKRNSFDYFKSTICHLVKGIGELDFIKEILCSDIPWKLYEKEWFPECLYLIAMIDYLCRKNDVPVYNGYAPLRAYKLREPLYPSGIYMLYLLTKDKSILDNSFDNSIPEFKRFNIVENEIEDVV